MGIHEHVEGIKAHWAKNFAFLDYFKKVYGRDKPLPKWTDADVDEFIASDPVYGPQVTLLLLLPAQSVSCSSGRPSNHANFPDPPCVFAAQGDEGIQEVRARRGSRRRRAPRRHRPQVLQGPARYHHQSRPI